MIIDNLKNSDKYVAIHPEFAAAFAALKDMFDGNVKPGKLVINGDKCFINVGEPYVNKPAEQCKFENHKKYVDIQCVLDGAEEIDIADCTAAPLKVEYKIEKDVEFYENPDNFTTALLGSGDFAVIFPNEMHRPCVAPNGVPTKVNKVVVKVLF